MSDSPLTKIEQKIQALKDNNNIVKYYWNQVQNSTVPVGYFLSNVIGPIINELALFDKQFLTLKNNVKLSNISRSYAKLSDQYYKLSSQNTNQNTIARQMNEDLRDLIDHVDSLTRDYEEAYSGLKYTLAKQSTSIAKSENIAKRTELMKSILIGLGIAGIGALALYFVNEYLAKDRKE